MMTPKALEGNDPVPSKINRRSAIRSTLAATVATGGSVSRRPFRRPPPTRPTPAGPRPRLIA